MFRCTHCRANGVYSDSGRLVCLLCGTVVQDLEPTVLEKLISNATPEDGVFGTPRLGADPAAITARVMATIRGEAAP